MVEMVSTLVKIEDECCCCFSKEDLFSMLEPYNFEENVEVYSIMITECFQIQLGSCVEECNRNLYLICKNCVFRLRDAITYRSQVRITYDRLEAKYCKMNKDRRVSIEYSSDIVDTKENKIKQDQDYMECNRKFLTGKDWNTTKEIKREGECCFCLRKEDLFSLLEPYNFEENVEIYSTMIAECFQIELSSYVEECYRNFYLICKSCVFRLRDAIMFRSQIQLAYDRLQAERCMKDYQDVKSSEYSEVIETKENITKYDISEYDNIKCSMNVDSGASLSNENVLNLKFIKIVPKRNDNNIIENVSVILTSAKSKGESQSRKRKPNSSHLNTCSFCNKSFKTKRNLLAHEKIHLGVKDFICDYCNRHFTNKRSLKDHILLHMGIKNIKCDLCDKWFVSKSALTSHRRIHSEENKKACKYCNKTFKTNQNLMAHEKIHLGVKDFICDYCNRDFMHKGSLKDHILLHIGIRNIKCDQCDSWFISKSALTSHKRCHSVRLPCNICGKTVNSKRSLERHILTHSGLTRKHKCEICEKSFVKYLSLLRHSTKHLETNKK